ncbi:MAG: Rieske (2Fe-2S) protein [Gemmatimonadetes bacterium]|nr:Rieske (2Fe-2S) protein [Gemmatimonadota bacterium]
MKKEDKAAPSAPREVPEAGDSQGEAPPSRRAFLWKAWIGLAAVAVAEGVWVALGFLRPRKPTEEEEASVLTAGPVDSFPPASVTAFPQGKFYLARLEDGGFLAVSRECTHLGCTVPWIEEEHRFVCPCHSSAFDIRGEVINPPAPRALDLFEVRIENRIVKVNTANVERRSAFSPGQVTRP